MEPTEQELEEEEIKIHLEEADGFFENLENMVQESLADFPDEDNSDVAQYAARIARASITMGTRTGHERIIRAYITYHLKRNPKWDPKAVTKQTPYDIRQYITQKCGDRSEGYEGCKFATAVSTRAALTLWYKSIRPHETVVEWSCDTVTGTCRGLPTRARAVSEFMIGLEKTKARAGDVSHSARAVTRELMYHLYDHCLRSDQEPAKLRWGIMRYHAYLLAFLMMLRIEEVLKLTFASFDMPPALRGRKMAVSMTTRKTAQTGVKHEWQLWAYDEEAKICPVRVQLLMAKLYGPSFPLVGPLYRRINLITGAIEQPITSGVLSRALAADLQAIGYRHWALYGTHSFRRGGCQYRVREKGWSVDQVAAWGGWTQVEAITMFRYYYSPNDNHEYMSHYDCNEATNTTKNVN